MLRHWFRFPERMGMSPGSGSNADSNASTVSRRLAHPAAMLAGWFALCNAPGLAADVWDPVQHLNSNAFENSFQSTLVTELKANPVSPTGPGSDAGSTSESQDEDRQKMQAAIEEMQSRMRRARAAGQEERAADLADQLKAAQEKAAARKPKNPQRPAQVTDAEKARSAARKARQAAEGRPVPPQEKLVERQRPEADPNPIMRERLARVQQETMARAAELEKRAQRIERAQGEMQARAEELEQRERKLKEWQHEMEQHKEKLGHHSHEMQARAEELEQRERKLKELNTQSRRSVNSKNCGKRRNIWTGRPIWLGKKSPSCAPCWRPRNAS